MERQPDDTRAAYWWPAPWMCPALQQRAIELESRSVAGQIRHLVVQAARAANKGSQCHGRHRERRAPSITVVIFV